jgi:4,5-DOPA dioxygenase extradiol
MQVVFVSHGAPTLALDAGRGKELRAWAESLERPRAILVVSAHWEAPVLTRGTTSTKPLVYDFSGFPDELFRVRYDAPGAPDVADRLQGLLERGGEKFDRDPSRGLDHGVWVPLVHMYPAADIPVLQLSLVRGASPAKLFALGQKLAPLRDEGVLVMGSGGTVHNLRELDPSPAPATPYWANEFDAWLANTLAEGDTDSLLEYRARAPEAQRAHPTPEHINPLFVAAGAASMGEHAVGFPIRGFDFGSLSRRCVQFGR